MSRKTIATCLIAAAGLATQVQAAGDVVISQLYIGGGFAAGTLPESLYQNDFIELHNRTNAAVSINGWSVQYAAVTGVNWTRIALPNVSIPAGGYYLIRSNANAFSCVTCVPVPSDFAGTGIDMSAATGATGGGKVALVNSATAITTGVSNPITDPTWGPLTIDFVGYGTANASEGGTQAPRPITPTPSGTHSIMRGPTPANSGCQDTDVNGSDFSIQPVAPRNASSATVNCAGTIVDCNSNGIPDATDIANNPSLDCNTNGAIDSCEISSNPGLDCNGNSVLDACEIAANPGLDCNANGKLDTCDIAADLDLDGGSYGCGAANGQIDSCETPGSGEDCNANGKKDCWDFKTWLLTDVDNNGIYDVCEGAIVVECTTNATVQPAGVRAATNGTDFFNVEGTVAGGTANYSYGALRWSNAAFGAPASISRVYLYTVQANAAFTSGGIPGLDPDNMEYFYTNQDAVNLAPGNTATTYANRNTDFPDLQSMGTSLFQESTITPADLPGANTAAGSGDVDAVKLFDAGGTNSAGATAMAGEISSGTGDLTLVLDIANNQGATAATFAGYSHALYRGPTLVVFPSTGPSCDTIDFNHDDLFPDTADIDDFLSVFSGGTCSNDPNCGDIDFNNDGLFPDTMDIDALLSVFSGGPCIV
ncbi:MAG: lamin tail domain-containing protein [Phycisphaerales bacterium]